jgi:3-phenylpropionate/cinnamic acid dioxygenase small subunit
MSRNWQPSAADLAELVYREARLLDAGRYEEWHALFAADGRYWVPLSADQTDPVGAQSIACEDKLLLAIRIQRLRNPKAHSMHPPPASQHVLQAPEIVRADPAANFYLTRTPFVYLEARGDGQICLGGTVTHQSRANGEALEIVLKRVDLVNASAALPPIFLFL